MRLLPLVLGAFMLAPSAHAAPATPTTDVECLAYNLYHEARNQNEQGLIAVADVTLNRVASRAFPNNICDVVKQGPVRESWNDEGVFYPVKHRCQFSWWCDGKDDTPLEIGQWRLAMALARQILIYDEIGMHVDITDGALYYHAIYVSPSWADGTKWPNGRCAVQTVQYETHIFYKLSSTCLEGKS